MERPLDAQALKARKRRAAVLAGGWGRAAQEAAWDQVWPRWREDLAHAMSTNIASFMGWEWQALSAKLNADGRFLAQPWSRLLIQSMYRRLDRQWVWARWGGYPI